MSAEGPIVYANEPLPVYIDDAASGKPAPGGGSVSACVGALGAALTSMVCNLTIGKEQFAAVEPQMKEVLAASEAVRAQLQQLLQDDTTAYSGVLVAYRLPKDTDEQKAARHQAVQAGLIVAADVPLEICRVAVEVCRLAKVAADLGNANAVTDAGIGALLGEAAAVGRRPQRAHQPRLDRRRGLRRARRRPRSTPSSPRPRRCAPRCSPPQSPRSDTKGTSWLHASSTARRSREIVREEIRAEVERLTAAGTKPGVATILVGDDGGARFYRGQIEKNTGTVGFAYFNHELPAEAAETEVLELVASPERRPGRARHPRSHADGRPHRPEQGLQRPGAREGPRLREPGQHRPRAARRPALRAGDALGLRRDPRPRGRRAAGPRRHDRQPLEHRRQAGRAALPQPQRLGPRRPRLQQGRARRLPRGRRADLGGAGEGPHQGRHGQARAPSSST